MPVQINIVVIRIYSIIYFRKTENPNEKNETLNHLE
jgi:hypothetical protein